MVNENYNSLLRTIKYSYAFEERDCLLERLEKQKKLERSVNTNKNEKERKAKKELFQKFFVIFAMKK